MPTARSTRAAFAEIDPAHDFDGGSLRMIALLMFKIRVEEKDAVRIVSSLIPTNRDGNGHGHGHSHGGGGGSGGSGGVPVSISFDVWQQMVKKLYQKGYEVQEMHAASTLRASRTWRYA